MITVAGNASNAIAYRNAVFSVIPKSITEKVYRASQNFITGDLSSEDKLKKARAEWIEFFKNEYNITEEEVIKLCGKQTINQIRGNEITILSGIHQSLKDGDTTVDELMKPYRLIRSERLKDMAKEAAGIKDESNNLFNNNESNHNGSTTDTGMV